MSVDSSLWKVSNEKININILALIFQCKQNKKSLDIDSGISSQTKRKEQDLNRKPLDHKANVLLPELSFWMI